MRTSPSDGWVANIIISVKIFLLIRSSGWFVFLKTKSGRIDGRRSRV